jgi:hypothetical protein
MLAEKKRRCVKKIHRTFWWTKLFTRYLYDVIGYRVKYRKKTNCVGLSVIICIQRASIKWWWITNLSLPNTQSSFLPFFFASFRRKITGHLSFEYIYIFAYMLNQCDLSSSFVAVVAVFILAYHQSKTHTHTHTHTNQNIKCLPLSFSC